MAATLKLRCHEWILEIGNQISRVIHVWLNAQSYALKCEDVISDFVYRMCRTIIVLNCERWVVDLKSVFNMSTLFESTDPGGLTVEDELLSFDKHMCLKYRHCDATGYIADIHITNINIHNFCSNGTVVKSVTRTSKSPSGWPLPDRANPDIHWETHQGRPREGSRSHITWLWSDIPGNLQGAE